MDLDGSKFSRILSLPAICTCNQFTTFSLSWSSLGHVCPPPENTLISLFGNLG